jgi:sugar lactone lactonase YvrE
VTSAGAAKPEASRAFRGALRVNDVAVRDATVALLRAGSTPAGARVLSTAKTDAGGRFDLPVPPNLKRADVLYATAVGGSIGNAPLPLAVELATALGDLRSGRIIINELTTVAAGYSLAQFAEAGSLGGADPGLANAAKMTRNLVDAETGRTARFLAMSPNGTDTETLSNFNSLASIIAGCAAVTNNCNAFLDAATDAWGRRPATTWQAMTLLPTNPSGDAPGVFAQIPANPAFTPVRTTAPVAWIIALRFYGNGRQFNGPGNVAFDAAGRVWANNNAQWSRRPTNICPGLELFRLDPYAAGRPMETFTGGGLNGAGFGIGIDPKANVWVSNFGFTGSLCTQPPTSNSVSEFRPNGSPRSGDNGYTDGPLSFPQGTISDVFGNVWIASCGANSLVTYPTGRHQRAKVVGENEIAVAFDVAQNTEGNVFVTANGGDQVVGFDQQGRQLPGSPYGDSSTIENPLGIASDSLGNVWVSNSGVLNVPCSPGASLDVPDDNVPFNGSIARVTAKGAVTRFTGAGLTLPWGIAVDGNDNLWVANFAGERLSHLCGARLSTCPAGQVGAALSPDTGYAFDGLQRNTGVEVDPSGNVWLANNWIEVPVPTDPFGDGLVVYLGMAAPVRTPLIGTPQQP